MVLSEICLANVALKLESFAFEVAISAEADNSICKVEEEDDASSVLVEQD